MFVTFFSNFLNDHQIPFCNAMYRLLNGQFRFVATQPMDDERLKMKFEDVSEKYPYAVNAYASAEKKKEVEKLAMESDVVIIGSAPDDFIEERLKENKLTFRYYERYFKEGRWRILDPRVFLAHYKMDMRYRKKPLYMLCASAYTAPDCRFIGCYRQKTFKWGYFPEVKTYDEAELMAKKPKDKVTLLWVGRQIGWKHPEAALRVAETLKKEGRAFEMTIVGDGEMHASLVRAVEKENLNDVVRLEPFMPQAEVRARMEKTNIFLFTSDRNEGWGAVLNEAMNSGCAVVANDEIGSVPFLLKNGKNGLSYHHTANDLVDKVKVLLNNDGMTERLGIAAYRTMRDTWNAENAAARLVTLFEGLPEGNIPHFEDGPVSRA